MTTASLMTFEALRDTAQHTLTRYETLRGQVAEILRDPTLPERKVALYTRLDEHAAKAPIVLGKIIDSEDLSAVDQYDLGFADIYIAEIDTFEDNLQAALKEA